MPESLTTFFQRALSQSSKSTVLKPLGWLIALCSGAATISSATGKVEWITVMFGVFAGISIALYIASYIYFAATDKDALRSEKYNIQSMAIQHGFIGDDQTGYIKVANPVSPAIDTNAIETNQEKGDS